MCPGIYCPAWAVKGTKREESAQGSHALAQSQQAPEHEWVSRISCCRAFWVFRV